MECEESVNKQTLHALHALLRLKRHILLQRRWSTCKIILNLRSKQAAVHVDEQATAHCHFNDGCARKYLVCLLVFQAWKLREKLAEPAMFHHIQSQIIKIYTNLHSPVFDRATQCRKQARFCGVSGQHTLEVTGFGISRVR